MSTDVKSFPFCEDMSNVAAPWFAFYGEVDQKLTYPDASMFDMVERAANLYPNYTAVTFMGKATKFRDLVREIREAARATLPLALADHLSTGELDLDASR